MVSLRADLPEGRPKLAHDLSEHDAIDTTLGPNRHTDADGRYKSVVSTLYPNRSTELWQ